MWQQSLPAFAQALAGTGRHKSEKSAQGMHAISCRVLSQYFSIIFYKFIAIIRKV
jgi:hypothetical protein